MEKDLNYYMKLPYRIVYEQDEDIWYAYIPELGRRACYGQGRTKEQALESLNLVKEDIITYCLEHNLSIVEPY